MIIIFLYHMKYSKMGITRETSIRNPPTSITRPHNDQDSAILALSLLSSFLFNLFFFFSRIWKRTPHIMSLRPSALQYYSLKKIDVSLHKPTCTLKKLTIIPCYHQILRIFQYLKSKSTFGLFPNVHHRKNGWILVHSYNGI